MNIITHFNKIIHVTDDDSKHCNSNHLLGDELNYRESSPRAIRKTIMIGETNARLKISMFVNILKPSQRTPIVDKELNL